MQHIAVFKGKALGRGIGAKQLARAGTAALCHGDRAHGGQEIGLGLARAGDRAVSQNKTRAEFLRIIAAVARGKRDLASQNRGKPRFQRRVCEHEIGPFGLHLLGDIGKGCHRHMCSVIARQKCGVARCDHVAAVAARSEIHRPAFQSGLIIEAEHQFGAQHARRRAADRNGKIAGGRQRALRATRRGCQPLHGLLRTHGKVFNEKRLRPVIIGD